MIMRNKRCKGGIEDRPATFPSEHHRLFAIIETLPGYSSKVLEGILMSSNQAIEVMVGRKVDVLPPGEAQDIGEALHLALAAMGEGNRIGTPIHLALLARPLFQTVSPVLDSGGRSFLSCSLRMLMPPG